ncbi:MAG: DNA polymerase III subunit chi [Methylobacteriaceae bacterium]|nr:DNA polymerase III subunit chi [Methylobacteriaceae bacterium]
MSEVYFYHLVRQPLEAVLPRLLALSLDRGWRALVKAASPERLAALDDHLWSFSEESFLPHGTTEEPDPGEQPVLLTLRDDNPNRAQALFLTDGAAMPDDVSGFERVALLLDGRDPDAVAAARATWRAAAGAGHAVSYWRQDDEGRWRKQA